MMEMLKNGKQANQSNTDIPQTCSSITLLKPGIGKPPLPLLWPITLRSKRTFTSGFTATCSDEWSSAASHALDLLLGEPLGPARCHGPAPLRGWGCWQTRTRWVHPRSAPKHSHCSTVTWEHHAQGGEKKGSTDHCLPTQDSPEGE